MLSEMSTGALIASFNPCFSGRCVLVISALMPPPGEAEVSILVLVEDVFWWLQGAGWKRALPVSILVLVEDVFW